MINLISLIGTFVLGIIGWIAYKVYIWPYYITPLRKIPGPSSDHLFYGNFKSIISEEAGEPHLRWVKKYGSIVKFYGFLNRPSVLVVDPKILQDVLLNKVYDFIKPPEFISSQVKIIGNGLIVAEGESHKRQRKMMNPAFTHHNIKEMVPTFTRVASTLISLIEDKVNAGQSKIILSPYISKTTLDIIGLTGFSYKFNSLTSQNELADAFSSLMKVGNVSFIMASVLSRYIPFFSNIPLASNIEMNKSAEVIQRVSRKLINEKLEDDKNNKLKGNDLLTLLINTNKTLPIEEKMTVEELKNQIMTFLLAGHETSSNTTCWVLHLLSQHPHEQDLLREELVKAFPDKSKFDPTFDEINSLEYLNCVIKETLRLVPPLTAIARVNTKDEVFGEHFIPKNSFISLGIGALHRLPSIWGPTAEEFNPKRWLDPSLIKNVTNFNYLPFITGTRACIGNKLALNEIKILVTMLIRNFVFQPVEGLHIRRAPIPLVKPDPYLELMVSKVEA